MPVVCLTTPGEQSLVAPRFLLDLCTTEIKMGEGWMGGEGEWRDEGRDGIPRQ